uniref:Uncharacterized protein n=1 Tax=Timema genevievae TaxID=629358 RepID=A0A7R9K452_TIMGE|nr:unnamed protein product [Timema genevievae]
MRSYFDEWLEVLAPLLTPQGESPRSASESETLKDPRHNPGDGSTFRRVTGICRMEPIIFLLAVVTLTVGVSRGESLLHSVAGEVGRGNYTYYTLMYEGPITLYLYSQSGDADIYVSQTTKKPTFEPDTYCLQSSTCGLDVIKIPRSFRRPVRIGVYGHPSKELSTFLLEAYYRDEEDVEDIDPFAEINAEEENNLNSRSGENIAGDRRKRAQERIDEAVSSEYYEKKEKPDNDSEGNESFIWTLIWSFIDILLEVLFL